MPDIVVRRACAGEEVAIASVHVATWKAAYRGIVPDDYLDSMDVRQRADAYDEDFLTLEERPVWVAERAGRVVGFVSAGPSRDEDSDGELYAIYIGDTEWGSGTGDALMREALTFLRERFRFATLWVLEANARARRFYEKFGWAPDGTVKEWRFRVAEVRYRIDF